MILSIVSRFEEVRLRENLNKSQFEKKLNKSSGYLNMLMKRDSNPGVDVMADFCKSFPHYSLDWLLTGEGEMLKGSERDKKESTVKEPELSYGEIKTMHRDIKQDLKALAEGMTHNFEVLSRGMKRSLQGQQKILDFIENLNSDEIKQAASGLNEFLAEKEE